MVGLLKCTGSTQVDYSGSTSSPNIAELNAWWEPAMKGAVPVTRYAHCTHYYNKKIYLFGGFNGFTCFNDLYTLDIGNKIIERA